MKKGMLLVALAVPTLLVTGCNEQEKSLTCTLTEDAGGATTTSVMDMNFKGNQVQDITLDITIDYTDEYKSFAEIFEQTLESQKTNLEDIGYEVKITSGENSLTLTAQGTKDTLDEEEITGSYDATKESLEEAGYTCK